MYLFVLVLICNPVVCRYSLHIYVNSAVNTSFRSHVQRGLKDWIGIHILKSV